MITGRTPVYALLGDPVRDSPSPRLHNRWLHALGIDGVYVALPTRTPEPVAAFRALGLAGANVTVPLKEVAAGQVDRCTATAEAAGAVNTLWWDGRSLVGDNTDGAGFVRALQRDGIDLQGTRAAIVGAGGAARGIAAACLDAGVTELTLLNRTVERAERLVERLERPGARLTATGLDSSALAGAEIVAVTVNADVPLDPSECAPRCHWTDIGYRAPNASTVRARAIGHRVRDGMAMLVWQAAFAFERWTGRPAPVVPTDFVQS